MGHITHDKEWATAWVKSHACSDNQGKIKKKQTVPTSSFIVNYAHSRS